MTGGHGETISDANPSDAGVVVSSLPGVLKRVVDSMNVRSFIADERGAYFPISYALTIGITVILLSGLMTGTASFVDQKTDNAANAELQIIGERLATQLMAVDQQVTENGDVEMTVRVDLPERAAGSHYNIRIRNRPAGGTDTLELWSTQESASVEIPIQLSSNVAESTAVSNGDLVITVDRNTVDRNRVSLGSE